MPGNNNGSFGNTSNNSTRGQDLIDSLNWIYSHIPAPHFILNGAVQNISDAKIRFVLNSFQRVTNSTLYDHPDQGETTSGYNSTAAINVYYGNCVGCAGYGETSTTDPRNFISLHSTNNNEDIAAHYWSRILAHEIGHVFDMCDIHNTNFYNMGIALTDGCCSQLVVNDYVLEPITNFPSIPCDVSCTNNLMSGPVCLQYLSPLQMAMIQYHLRTDNRFLLTANSFNSDLAVQSSADYNVTSNETWTTDRFFKGNIHVKANQKLEILCNVYMTKDASIIVEPQGQLVINTGGHVSNFIPNQLWGGIMVWGNTTAGQIINNTTGFASSHGVARIINGGKISNANNAVRNYVAFGNGPNAINWSSMGGIIIGNGGIFVNNTRDVEFLSYHNSVSGHDASYFTNCDFLTTSSAPPFPFAHITMWAVRGVQFRGCHFEYTPNSLPMRGTGILSMDAEYYIDQQSTTKTTFKHLKQGVSVLNSNPLKLAFIKNTIFEENWLDGTFFKNMNFAQFEKNELITPVTTLGNGLYLYTCQNYKVKLNEFHEMVYNPWGSIANGLYAYKSLGGAHEVYKNKFYDLGIGVNAMDKNSSDLTSFDDGLKINCNDFSQSANIVDVALTHTNGLLPPTVMTEQGLLSTQIPTLVVRNIYGAYCNNGENQWYMDPSASKQIDHGSNTQSYTQPLPQPSCSDYLVNVANTGIPLIYSDHCLDYPESNGGTFTNGSEALDNLNSYLVDLVNINNNNDQYFEIQSTLASKINLFLTDSLVASNDSVIATLLNYGNYIADSDLQLVFAYMHNGDFGEAQAAINNLDSTRSDWAALLDFMLDIEQDSMKYYRLLLDTNAVDFLEEYAYDSDKDGQSIAQAILTYILGYGFEEPRTFIDAGQGERRWDHLGNDFVEDRRYKNTILLHPNPTENFVEISSEVRINGTIEVLDLLGRVVLSKKVMIDSKQQLSLEGMNNGVYLIRILDPNSGIVFKEKLVKQE